MADERTRIRRTVSVTAPTAPVRGFFRPRPWTKPDAHGCIADRGGPESRFETHKRRSTAYGSDGTSGL